MELTCPLLIDHRLSPGCPFFKALTLKICALFFYILNLWWLGYRSPDTSSGGASALARSLSSSAAALREEQLLSWLE
jgi:hypothetical protein